MFKKTRFLTIGNILIYVLCSAQVLATDKEPLVIVENGKYGYIDHDGKIVIRPQFLWAEDFEQGMGTVYVCGRYVSINAAGKIHPLRITPPSRLEVLEKDGKYGFVDFTGSFKIPPAFDNALPFSGGYAAVKVGEKWGFIDPEGELAIEPQFEEAYYFREGIGNISIDSEPAFIDTTGKIIARGYRYVQGVISQGRIPVDLNRKSGYLDLQGKVVIPLEWDRIDTFSEGLAAVRLNDKWGYIDLDGHEKIPCKFDYAGRFSNGLAPVRIGNKSGFIDKSGEFVFRLDFRYAPGFIEGDEEGFFGAPSDVSRFWTDDNKFGYVNTSGQVIWGPAEGSPDHAPILGWSEDLREESCEGIPDEIRKKIDGFPRY